MPQGDGTGPLGKGPGVGKGQAICNRDPKNRGGGDRKSRDGNQATGKGQGRGWQRDRRQPDNKTR